MKYKLPPKFEYLDRLPGKIVTETDEQFWRRRLVEGVEAMASRMGLLVVAILLLAGCVGWLLLYGGKW